MDKATELVKSLLETIDYDGIDGRDWPEFAAMSADEWTDYLFSLPAIWLSAGIHVYPFGLAADNNMLLSLTPNIRSFRFASEEKMNDFITAYENREKARGNYTDVKKHIYTYAQEPDVPKYSVDQKRPHVVYEHDPYIFLKLPHDPTFIRREGLDMGHCLSTAHQDYCRRMIAGEIEVYSMTDTRDGLPKVDIEVALTKGSYSHAKVDKPVVTQVRGIRNEMPPKDEYLEPLMAFFQDYGKNWTLSGHKVHNFDGQIDGDRVVLRWQQLQGERAGGPS